jgi:hypothetical protein
VRALYRGLPTAEFAAGFLRGEIWITTFVHCRRVEDKVRQDAGEGTLLYAPGPFEGSLSDQIGRAWLQHTGVQIPKNVDPEHIKMVIDAGATFTRYLTDAYLLCFSSDAVAAAKFGPHIVRINCPRILFRELSRAILRFRPNITADFFGPVQYGSRNYGGADAPQGFQPFIKPAVPFAEEKEHRIVWQVGDCTGVQPFLLNCPAAASLCSRWAPPAPIETD